MGLCGKGVCLCGCVEVRGSYKIPSSMAHNLGFMIGSLIEPEVHGWPVSRELPVSTSQNWSHRCVLPHLDFTQGLEIRPSCLPGRHFIHWPSHLPPFPLSMLRLFFSSASMQQGLSGWSTFLYSHLHLLPYRRATCWPSPSRPHLERGVQQGTLPLFVLTYCLEGNLRPQGWHVEMVQPAYSPISKERSLISLVFWGHSSN